MEIDPKTNILIDQDTEYMTPQTKLMTEINPPYLQHPYYFPYLGLFGPLFIYLVESQKKQQVVVAKYKTEPKSKCRSMANMAHDDRFLASGGSDFRVHH